MKRTALPGSPAPSSASSSATPSSVPTTPVKPLNPNLKPEVSTFSDTSRPGPRSLPRQGRVWTKLLAGLLVALPLWSGFLFTVWNQEKLSSSIFLQLMRQLRTSSAIKEVIGDAVRIEPVWWLNGEGIVWGEISHPTGSIDLSFRVKGTVGSGTLYFTSLRKGKGQPWSLVRFRLISDDGRIVNVDPREGLLGTGEEVVDAREIETATRLV